MAVHSLYPNHVVIYYASVHGEHKATFPVVGYTPDVTPGEPGYLTTRAGTSAQIVDDDVIDFIDILAAFHLNTTVFTGFTVYEWPDEDGPAQPVYTKSVNIAGGQTPGAAWDAGTQQTTTWRTSLFGVFKVVLLDLETGGSFNKIVSPTAYAALSNLHDFVTDEDGWLCGRDGARPVTFLQSSITLNDSLRRRYNLN